MKALLVLIVCGALAASVAAQEAGVLRFGGDAEGGAPFMEADPNDPSRVVGFEVDIAALLATGLGRRLANEVCHRAKLSPFAMTGKLGLDGATATVAAIRDAVAEGLEYERGRDDMSSSKDRPGRVHGRAGEPCPVCGDVVRAVEYSGYTVNYCATCQTGGKVLADNTTSKFLK